MMMMMDFVTDLDGASLPASPADMQSGVGSEPTSPGHDRADRETVGRPRPTRSGSRPGWFCRRDSRRGSGKPRRWILVQPGDQINVINMQYLQSVLAILTLMPNRRA